MNLEALLIIVEIGRFGQPIEHQVSQTFYSTMAQCIIDAAEFNSTRFAREQSYYASCKVKEGD